MSLRKIEQITGHHRDTIGNILYKSTSQPEKLNKFLSNELGFEENDIIRFWIYINDGRKKLSFEAKLYLMEQGYSDPRF